MRIYKYLDHNQSDFANKPLQSYSDYFLAFFSIQVRNNKIN